MLRHCNASDIDAIGQIINDAAQAYRGVTPPDRWHEPYMPRDALEAEIAKGVVFWGWDSLEGSWCRRRKRTGYWTPTGRFRRRQREVSVVLVHGN